MKKFKLLKSLPGFQFLGDTSQVIPEGTIVVEKIITITIYVVESNPNTQFKRFVVEDNRSEWKRIN